MIYYLTKEDFEKYVKKLQEIGKDYSLTGNKELKKEYDCIEKVLNKVKFIEKSEKKDDVIYIGDNVNLLFDGEEEVESYKLVIGFPNSMEEVSISSPVGEALVQRFVGEERKYNVNGKTFGFRIVEKQNTAEKAGERV